MTRPDPRADPSPADEAALRQLFAHLAEDPDAPPSPVSALSVGAVANRRGEAHRGRVRTSLLTAACLAAVALLVPVVLRASGGSETTSASSAGAQYTSAAGAASAAAPSAAGAPATSAAGAVAPVPDQAPPDGPGAGPPGGGASTAAAGSVSAPVGSASAAAAAPAASGQSPSAALSSSAASAAGSAGTCAVPSLDPAAVAAVVDALAGRGGVVQEEAPAVLPCERGGLTGTVFDVVAGERAGSLQVSVLDAAPAECAAGCPAVTGTAGVLLADAAGSAVAVAVPGTQRWVVLEQKVGNVSGLPELGAVPFTAVELVAAGEAVLAAG